MSDVWILHRYSSGSNSYTVGRTEDWELKLAQSFEKEDDAKEFVKDGHRKHNEFVILSHTLTDSEKEEFLNEFSFSERYLLKRKFFIGEKSSIIANLKKNLQLDQVKILNI